MNPESQSLKKANEIHCPVESVEGRNLVAMAKLASELCHQCDVHSHAFGVSKMQDYLAEVVAWLEDGRERVWQSIFILVNAAPRMKAIAACRVLFPESTTTKSP